MKSRLERSVTKALILARAFSRAEDCEDISPLHLLRGAIAAHYRSLIGVSRPSIRNLKSRSESWTRTSKLSLATAGRLACQRHSSTITIRDLMLALREVDADTVDEELLKLTIDPDKFFSLVFRNSRNT
jgi:hypothetical protein